MWHTLTKKKKKKTFSKIQKQLSTLYFLFAKSGNHMARLCKGLTYSSKEFRLYSIGNKDLLRSLTQRSDIGKVVFETSQKTTVQVENSEIQE